MLRGDDPAAEETTCQVEAAAGSFIICVPALDEEKAKLERLFTAYFISC
jgi:hypothetical protein